MNSMDEAQIRRMHEAIFLDLQQVGLSSEVIVGTMSARARYERLYAELKQAVGDSVGTQWVRPTGRVKRVHR